MPWVLIDTSAWVNAFRVETSAERQEIDLLLASDEAATVGMVIAELLRGARNEREFLDLRTRLSAPHFLPARLETWVLTGRILFDLQRLGETIPLQDALIAAQALEANAEVYTNDPHFQRVPGLKLHEVNSTT